MTLGSAAKKASEETEQRRGTPGERTTRSRVIGFFAGPLLGLLLFLVLPEMPLPLEEGETESVMSLNGSIVAAVTAWIAIWWATEPIPIPATSLLPLVLFPLFIDGVGVEDVSPSYGSDVIFLFMGGFIDRKSTRLNSSHVAISYAVFCLKKKNKRNKDDTYIATCNIF